MGVTHYARQLPDPALLAECGTVYLSWLRHPRHAGGTVRTPKLRLSILRLYINSNPELKMQMQMQMKDINVYCKASKISQ